MHYKTFYDSNKNNPETSNEQHFEGFLKGDKDFSPVWCVHSVFSVYARCMHGASTVQILLLDVDPAMVHVARPCMAVIYIQFTACDCHYCLLFIHT